MRKLFIILIVAFVGVSVHGAAGIDGAIRIQSGSSTTNTKSSAVTITAQTNVFAGTVTLSNMTASTFPVANASKVLVSATNTGSGSVVLATKPILSNAMLTGRVWLTDGSTITPDLSLGTKFAVVLGGNRTLAAPSNGTSHDGQTFEIFFIQDSTGSRTITLATNYIAGTDITGITLTTTASKGDYVGFDYFVTNNVATVRAAPRGYSFSP